MEAFFSPYLTLWQKNLNSGKSFTKKTIKGYYRRCIDVEFAVIIAKNYFCLAGIKLTVTLRNLVTKNWYISGFLKFQIYEG